MLIAMLSLLGIPLFAGFVGKFLVLKSLAVNGLLSVLIIIVFASLLESVYYFKLAGFMFNKDKTREVLKISFMRKLVFTLLAFLLLFIGMAPFTISPFLSESATNMLDSLTYINNLSGGK